MDYVGFVREDYGICDRCGQPIRHPWEAIDLDGSTGYDTICMDCFIELCHKREIVDEYFPEYIKENKQDFLHFWWDYINISEWQDAMIAAYENWRKKEISEGRGESVARLQKEYADLSGGWEDFLLSKLGR